LPASTSTEDRTAPPFSLIASTSRLRSTYSAATRAGKSLNKEPRRPVAARRGSRADRAAVRCRAPARPSPDARTRSGLRSVSLGDPAHAPTGHSPAHAIVPANPPRPVSSERRRQHPRFSRAPSLLSVECVRRTAYELPALAGRSAIRERRCA